MHLLAKTYELITETQYVYHVICEFPYHISTSFSSKFYPLFDYLINTCWHYYVALLFNHSELWGKKVKLSLET